MGKTFLISDTHIHDIFKYDPNTGNLYWKIKPCQFVDIGDIAGSQREDGYTEVGLFSHSYLLHRLVYFYHYGFFPKLIDHIDRDRTNNRIENLREANRRLNAYNCGLPKNNKSGYRGVSWCKQQSKWIARFKLENKYLFLGAYTDREEAYAVRLSFERRHHE